MYVSEFHLTSPNSLQPLTAPNQKIKLHTKKMDISSASGRKIKVVPEAWYMPLAQPFLSAAASLVQQLLICHPLTFTDHLMANCSCVRCSMQRRQVPVHLHRVRH